MANPQELWGKPQSIKGTWSVKVYNIHVCTSIYIYIYPVENEQLRLKPIQCESSGCVAELWAPRYVLVYPLN